MKTVLITWASSWIGAEFAKVFAQNNYNLVLVARNSEKLEQIATKLSSENNIKIEIINIDLSKQWSWKKTIWWS